MLILPLMLGLTVSSMAPQTTPAKITVGAIRWDGWWDGNPWEKHLQPKEWHDRLPFYATTGEDGRVRVIGDDQKVLDREIIEAQRGGLDYWAICYYHPDSWSEADRYNYAWRRFLKSRERHRLRYAFLLQGGQHLGPKAKWKETTAFFAERASEPRYQLLPGKRPLFYMFTVDQLEAWAGGKAEAKAAMETLREACRAKGLGEPYLVAQVFDPTLGARAVDDWGFDAISGYSLPPYGEKTERSYADLAEGNRWYRQLFVNTGKSVVPLANAGWDGRPRWPSPEWAVNYQGPWFRQPTPAEFGANVTEMLTWLRANPTVAPAQTLLIYAWNETDEGGWLVPTRTEDRVKLDALARAIRPFRK